MLKPEVRLKLVARAYAVDEVDIRVRHTCKGPTVACSKSSNGRPSTRHAAHDWGDDREFQLQVDLTARLPSYCPREAVEYQWSCC